LLAGEAKPCPIAPGWLVPDRFYLECSAPAYQEPEYLEAAVRMAAATGTPVVATNDVRFITADDFEPTSPYLHPGRPGPRHPRRPRRYSEQQYLKSPVEMTPRPSMQKSTSKSA